MTIVKSQKTIGKAIKMGNFGNSAIFVRKDPARVADKTILYNLIYLEMAQK